MQSYVGTSHTRYNHGIRFVCRGAWHESDDPTVVSYKIYWRYTSEPQWQFSRDVGKVTEATLKNIVIDNYYFGVAAVNKDGIESPVVFPGDVGAFEWPDKSPK